MKIEEIYLEDRNLLLLQNLKISWKFKWYEKPKISNNERLFSHININNYLFKLDNIIINILMKVKILILILHKIFNSQGNINKNVCYGFKQILQILFLKKKTIPHRNKKNKNVRNQL